jgi:uncharacterized protein (UPF0333 family)
MIMSMRGAAWKEYKILGPIILLVLVLVVHDFTKSKRPTKYTFHYKSST